MATPLRFEIVRQDGTMLDVSRQVTLAKLKYGVEIDEDFVAYAKSQGEVNVNDWRGDHVDTETWKRLNIYAMTELVFACSIVNVGIYGSQMRLRIFIELLASATLPFQVVRRTTGFADETLEDFIGAAGLNMSRPANVSLPAMHVAAGTGYDGRVEVERQGGSYTVKHLFEDGGSQFLEDVLAFGSMFGFERPRQDGFVVYPLQGLKTDARRAVSNARVASRSALVLERDLAVDGRIWNYGLQTLNVASASIGSRSRTVLTDADWERRHTNTRSQWFTPSDLIGSSDGGNWLEWTSVSVEITNFSGPNPTVESTSGGRLRARTRDTSGTLSSSNQIRWTLSWRARLSISISQALVTADDIDNFSRELATSGLPIPASGANHLTSIAAVEDTLDALAGGRLKKVAATQLLDQSGDLSPLQVSCGDLVEIDVAGSANRCVLTGVEFRHRGLKPIQLRWHTLVLGDIERPPVMFKGIPVVRGGVQVERIA